MEIERVEWTQASRKHHLGRARILTVMNNYEPTYISATDDLDARWWWVGVADDLEIEVMAVILTDPDRLLVIHAMPTSLRRK